MFIISPPVSEKNEIKWNCWYQILTMYKILLEFKKQQWLYHIK